MREKTNPPGGMPCATLEALRSTPDWQALVASLAIQQRKQAAWHELRMMALERMRDTLNAPDGIECPAILEAGRQLALAEPTGIKAPFEAFQEAVITRSRHPAGPEELAAIEQLTVRACDLFQALAEAAAKEREASNAAAVIRAQAEQMALENQKRGGIH